MLFGVVLAIGLGEALLRILVDGEVIRPDVGFGAFVRQVKYAQALSYGVLRQYEAAAFEGNAPGLFRSVADQSIGWEPVPGVQAGHIRINSGGFRGPEYPPRPPPGRRRVALLGDSEVFGMALAEPQTLSGCLESQLNELGAGQSFEVLNFGVPGYNTDQELAQLEQKVLQYHPEIVVLYYCFNDPETSTRRVILGEGFWSRTYLGLFVVFLERSFETFDAMRGSSRNIAEYYLRLHQSAYFEKTRQMLRRMGDILAQRGVPMFLLIGTELAGYDNLRTGYPYQPIHAALTRLGSDRITIIDPMPLLAAESADPKDFWVTPSDTHKNARANRINARKVAEEILKKTSH